MNGIKKLESFINIIIKSELKHQHPRLNSD